MKNRYPNRSKTEQALRKENNAAEKKAREAVRFDTDCDLDLKAEDDIEDKNEKLKTLFIAIDKIMDITLQDTQSEHSPEATGRMRYELMLTLSTFDEQMKE